MTDMQRLTVTVKNLKTYSGPWEGEIRWLAQECQALVAREAALRVACEPLRDCEGDMHAVHVPHPIFSAFKAAVFDS